MSEFIDMGGKMGEVLVAIWNAIITHLPGLVAAILILVFGYFVAWLLGWIVKWVLDKLKVFQWLVKQAKLNKFVGKWDFPKFFGIVTKWGVFVLFLGPAANFVKLAPLVTFLTALSLWVPNLILAVVIAFLGIVLAEFVAHQVAETDARNAALVGTGAKVLILIFAFLMALKQMGVAVSLAENAFLIILAGIMLAVAIAFGMGLKEEASDLVKDLRKKL